MRSATASTDVAPTCSVARSRRSSRARRCESAPGARERLDPAHARADAPLAGDDEAPDLAAGAAVRAAAQLEAVVLDADGPNRLAVLLVEEGVRAALDRLGHRQELDRHRPVLADDPADLVLDRAASRRRSAPDRTGSRSAGTRAPRASPPASPDRRRRSAAPDGAGACRCGCASCARAGPRRPRPSRCRPRRRGRGACRAGRSARRSACPPRAACPRPRRRRSSSRRSTPRSPIWPPPSA